MLPVEPKGPFAKREAVEVHGEHTFQRLELLRRAGVDAAFECILPRNQDGPGRARPIGPTRIAREDYRAAMCIEGDREVVAPVLAELLEIP